MKNLNMKMEWLLPITTPFQEIDKLTKQCNASLSFFGSFSNLYKEKTA